MRFKYIFLPNGFAKPVQLLLLLVAALLFAGCAATQISLEKKDLKVETQMSDTVFLNLDDEQDKTVYLDIRNTSDKDIDLTPYIAARMEDKDYTVVNNPKDAYYIIQGNILYVGMANPSALRESVYQGWGGVAGGAAAQLQIGVRPAKILHFYAQNQRVIAFLRRHGAVHFLKVTIGVHSGSPSLYNQ